MTSQHTYISPSRSERQAFSRDLKQQSEYYTTPPVRTMKKPDKPLNTPASFSSPEQRKEAAQSLKGELPATGGISPSIRLSGHVDRINGHLLSIKGSQFEIGKELIEIIQEKDYAEDTFEEFVKNTFGWTRQRAYELAEGYAIKAELPANVINLLQNPGQAKALKAAPKDERAEILTEVAATGEVTAAKITEKVKEKKSQKQEPKDAEFKEIVKDKNGDEIPEPIQAEFLRAERESKENIERAQQIKNWLEPDDKTTIEVREGRDMIKDFISLLKTRAKHVLCPKCHGKKCKVCSFRGFVSNYFATKGIGKAEE